MKSLWDISAAERPMTGPFRAVMRILGWREKVRVKWRLFGRKLVRYCRWMGLVGVGSVSVRPALTSAPLRESLCISYANGHVLQEGSRREDAAAASEKRDVDIWSSGNLIQKGGKVVVEICGEGIELGVIVEGDDSKLIGVLEGEPVSGHCEEKER